MPQRFDDIAKRNLGSYFKKCRQRVDLTQSEVAVHLNLKGPQQLSNIERGEAFFTTKQLLKIIDIYKIPRGNTLAFVSDELKNSFRREVEVSDNEGEQENENKNYTNLI